MSNLDIMDNDYLDFSEEIKRHSLIILTPIYEDSTASSRLFSELFSIYKDNVFVIAVDDGSVHEPIDINNITDHGISGIVLKLKRNVGHQKAIAIGLSYVKNYLNKDQKVIVMDSDGEDPPSSIKELINTSESLNYDVVVAERKKRVESVFFRFFYVIYRLLFFMLSGRKISFGNFMLLKHSAVMRMTAMQELWIHIPGSVLISKLRIGFCPLDRGLRYAGQSKMRFVGLALHGFKGLMVFAEDVLVRVGTACAFVAALAVSGISTAILLKIFGYATPGWFSVVSGIMLLVFLQMGALSLTTLLLTGVVKSGGISTTDYVVYIDKILYDEKNVKFKKSK